MRILQPADWSKPRGFSHGVEIDAPGRWIVLAGQTGDENGEYPVGHGRAGRRCLAEDHQAAGGGAAPGLSTLSG